MNKTSGKYFIVALIFVLLSCGIYACQKKEPENSSAAPAGSMQSEADIASLTASMNMHYFSEPLKAPEFELPSVDGDTVNLSRYRGKVVLLSFWATW